METKISLFAIKYPFLQENIPFRRRALEQSKKEYTERQLLQLLRVQLLSGGCHNNDYTTRGSNLILKSARAD